MSETLSDQKIAILDGKIEFEQNLLNFPWKLWNLCIHWIFENPLGNRHKKIQFSSAYICVWKTMQIEINFMCFVYIFCSCLYNNRINMFYILLKFHFCGHNNPLEKYWLWLLCGKTKKIHSVIDWSSNFLREIDFLHYLASSLNLSFRIVSIKNLSIKSPLECNKPLKMSQKSKILSKFLIERPQTFHKCTIFTFPYTEGKMESSSVFANKFLWAIKSWTEIIKRAKC